MYSAVIRYTSLYHKKALYKQIQPRQLVSSQLSGGSSQLYAIFGFGIWKFWNLKFMLASF